MGFSHKIFKKLFNNLFFVCSQMTFDNKFYDFSGSQGCSYLLTSDFLHNRLKTLLHLFLMLCYHFYNRLKTLLHLLLMLCFRSLDCVLIIFTLDSKLFDVYINFHHVLRTLCYVQIRFTLGPNSYIHIILQYQIIFTIGGKLFTNIYNFTQSLDHVYFRFKTLVPFSPIFMALAPKRSVSLQIILI